MANRQTTDSNDVILSALRLERGMVAEGGYGALVRNPRRTPVYFTDSPVCLNFGNTENETREACDACPLMQFVPEQQRCRSVPCHYIPLNERGETVASLLGSGDRDHTEDLLLRWLDVTISELEKRPGGA